MAHELNPDGRRTVPGATVPPGWTAITVPPVPEGKRSGWRRTVDAAEPGATGTEALPGNWLTPGDAVALPAGTVLLLADKAATGTDHAYQTARAYTTEDATVRAELLTSNGTLTLLWGPQHFRRSSTALGKTVTTALARLLEQHPAPGQDREPIVLAEAQRPNRRKARCWRCARPAARGTGHLVGHGAEAQTEHWPTCPAPGTPDASELPQPRRRPGCDNCDRSGRSHEAVDSSGIPGRVCGRCSGMPSYLLSFA
ncbi:hypothetical protein [Streptomyces nanshensis]|uniref:Uncharacterized protein n=1 Tax=Streptomyces nanshensis TaxID=518642 RepID=A0A1E7L5Q2_9ACTN|nr:hypothetical protein [Streptomyces nanshensis]OEV11343.1 hypothetical protein AN218_13420 [Streptomyces nanshensis]